MNRLLIALFGLMVGCVAGYVIMVYSPFPGNPSSFIPQIISPRRQVIGFLPYWLAGKENSNYSRAITTLAYFSLTVEPDGSIRRLMNEQEEEPGWHALKSGAMDSFLDDAKKNNITRSLVIFNADEDDISALLSDPVPHAKTLVDSVSPLMRQHGFTDLNLDIESVSEASPEARANFTRFIQTVKAELKSRSIGTLTLEASPTVLIKPYLIDAHAVAPYVDTFVFMTYDYHYQGSSVTGPVAPLSGAGTVSEFDTAVAMQIAKTVMDSSKIIVGIPLYGYEWETIADTPRSAVIPGTGITASNLRVEQLMASCATCSAHIDTVADESYVIYKDAETNVYHQLFFPDAHATEAKVRFVTDNHLGGLAVWALGYEGKTIMDPLVSYLH